MEQKKEKVVVNKPVAKTNLEYVQMEYKNLVQYLMHLETF
jgi:hypothetical protein